MYRKFLIYDIRNPYFKLEADIRGDKSADTGGDKSANI